LIDPVVPRFTSLSRGLGHIIMRPPICSRRPGRSRFVRSAAAAGAVGLSALPGTGPRAAADTYNWQVAGATDVWSTTPADANWFVNGGTTPAPWVDGNAAVFAAATGETVTLSGTVLPTTVAVGANNGSWTFTGAGVIAGPSTGLTKSGTGTLTFTTSAPSTFAGRTIIDGGTISLGTGGTGAATTTVNALGDSGVTVNPGGTLRYWIKNDATFTFGYNLFVDGGALHGEDGVNQQTGSILVGPRGATFSAKWNNKNLVLAGPISGTGLVAVRRAVDGGGESNATVIVTGNNTYTGGTTLLSGALRVGLNNTALGTGPLTAIGNATFGTAAGGGTRVLANPVAVNPGVTLSLDAVNAQLQLTGTVSGAGAVSKANGGDLIFSAANQFTGGLTVNGGNVRISASDAGYGSGPITVAGGTTLATSNVTGSGPRSVANPITVNDGVTLSADGGYSTITFLGPITGGGNFAKASSGTVILAGDNSYAGTTSTGTNGALQIGNGGATGTLGGGPVTINAGSSLTFNRGDAFAYGGTASGAGPVVVAGTGTTTLGGAHTYTGTTTVNNGTLELTGSLTSNVVVAAGGRLAGSGSTTGTVTLADGSFVLAANGGVQAAGVTATAGTTGANVVVPGGPTGGGTAVVDVIRYGAGPAPAVANFNAAAYRNGVVVDDAANQKITLAYASDARTWNGGTGAWDTGATANWAEGDQKFFWNDAVTFNNPAAAATVTYAGNVSPASLAVNNTVDYTLANANTGSIVGTGSLTKSGAGTLTLTGTSPNRYSGGTTINGGTLSLGTGGTGANTSSPNALGAGTVTVNAGGTLKLWIQNSTTFTIPNNLVFDGGRLQSEDGNYVVNGAITINAGGMSAGTRYNNKTMTIAGNISGPGTFTAAGFGTGVGTFFSLTGTNSYGATVVTSGTLQIGNGGTTGTLGTGDVTVAAAATLALNRADAFAVPNVIGGPGSLTKLSAGTATLAAANTYTGATTVSAGTLLVAGSLANSAVTVTGGAVGGTGSIAGPLAVAAAGTVSPGAASPAIGTLAVGATTLAGTSLFELGTPGPNVATPGTSDLLSVVGNLTLGGTIALRDNFDANAQGVLGDGVYKLYAYTGTLSGAPTAITGPDGHAYALDTSIPGSVYLNVTAVPEPVVGAVLAAAGGLGLLGRRRRRATV
jgi:fibronectin-binding autotransporter adhesin